MSNYLFVYHGGTHPESEEEIAKVMAAWGAWFGAMGEAVVDPGNPVGMSSTVNADGSVADNGGSNPASGYTTIAADSLKQALDHAKGCPILEAGGSVEVAEIMPVEM